MELVSVIIPVYNVKPYLSEAIESVISQTYQDLEIILVDDGSTDGSGEICDAYAGKDTRIRVIHQENKGLSAARNAGLDQATGFYIAFLDPDDVYDRTFVEKMAGVLLSTDSDISVCRYADLKTKKTQPFIDPGIYDRIFVLRALVDGTLNWSVWNKAYKRELWESVRFPDGYVYEDLDTLYKLFEKCKSVVVLDDVLYFHRDRPGSITHTFSEKNLKDMIRAYSHFLSFVERNTTKMFKPDQLIKTRRRYFNILMVCYIRHAGKNRFHEKLKRKIIKTAREMKTFGFRSRVAYDLLCYAPWLLYSRTKFFSVLDDFTAVYAVKLSAFRR